MNPFFIIFVGIPAIEIFLLIKIGGDWRLKYRCTYFSHGSYWHLFCKTARNSNIKVWHGKFISEQNTDLRNDVRSI